jgi:hypothetical protein
MADRCKAFRLGDCSQGAYADNREDGYCPLHARRVKIYGDPSIVRKLGRPPKGGRVPVVVVPSPWWRRWFKRS